MSNYENRHYSQEEFNKSGDELSSYGKQAGQNISKKYSKELSKKAYTAVKKTAQTVAKHLTSDAIMAWVSSALSALIGTVGTPIIVLLIVLMIVPMGLFGLQFLAQDTSGAQTVKDNVKEAVRGAWNSLQGSSNTKDTIIGHINSNYNCDANTMDMTINDGKYTIWTDTCEITISFAPDLDTVASSVSAYASAVNGTIVVWGGETILDDPRFTFDEKGNAVDYDLGDFPDPSNANNYITNTNEVDEKGLPVFHLSNTVVDIYKDSANNEYLDATNESFAREIRNKSGEFFDLEEEFELWEDNNISQAVLTRERDVCYQVRDAVTEEQMHEKVPDGYCQLENTNYKWEKEEYEVNGYKGNATIPIYFDVTPYKQERLEEIAEEIVARDARCIIEPISEDAFGGNEKCTHEEAEYLVFSSLKNYWLNSMEYFGVEDLSYFGGSYLGVAGFSGVASYSGSLDYNMYAGNSYRYGSPIAQLIWGHAHSLHNQGLIRGSTTNPKGGCTYFAQMWFYDHHGFNQSNRGASGHGKQWADVLIKTHPDKFERGTSPAPYGVVSLQYGTYGHVFCIDAVDYVNGTVTFSEGNYDGNGGVKIQNTISLNDFYKRWRGVYVFANPTPEYYAELQAKYGQ